MSRRNVVEKSYDFDDVLIRPRYSSVNSREDVDLSLRLGSVELRLPIIGSPMELIMGVNLAKKLSDLGAIGILHKFYPDKKIWKEHIDALRGRNFGFAIGMNFSEFDIAYGLEAGASIICIDVANGYLQDLLMSVNQVKDFVSRGGWNTLVMAGNIATKEGAENLENAGADIIRIGIGSGGLCTTRNVTGIGIPQITAILESADDTEKSYFIADGGIRNSGDIAKAIVAGAHGVMVGSAFGRVYESAHFGEIRGMASKKQQEEYYHMTKSIEGITRTVKKDIYLEELLNDWAWNLRSACTYVNARNLDELYLNGEFIESGTGSIKKL